MVAALMISGTISAQKLNEKDVPKPGTDAFAKKYPLRVIEDAAHAFGCRYHGRKIGSFGDVVWFSFDGIKNITSGEGGAVVSSDLDVLEKVKDARLLGVEKDTEKRFAGQRSWDFNVTTQGWRYHMSEVMAAIGRVQLCRLDSEFAPRRIEIARYYRNELTGIEKIKLFDTAGEDIIPHIFPIRVLQRRDALREFLMDAGIEAGIHYKPSHLLTRFQRQGIHLPVVEKLYPELLTLPLHPSLTNTELEKIVSQIKTFFG